MLQAARRLLSSRAATAAALGSRVASNCFGNQRVRPWLASALQAAGFEKPLPVQQAAMNEIAHHNDTVLHAETGSGKTLSYLVPILSRLDPGRPMQLLVLLPHRELALQVALEVHRLVAPSSSLNVALVVGGTGATDESATHDGTDAGNLASRTLKMQRELLSEVAAQRAEVVVATPVALSRVLHSDHNFSSRDKRQRLLERLVPAGDGTLPAVPLTEEQYEHALKHGWAATAELPGGHAKRGEGRSSRRDAAGRLFDGTQLAGPDVHPGDASPGAKLLLLMATNLDAVVLDEVDALLPKPVLDASVGYYRKRDWVVAGRDRRGATRAGNSDSSKAAKVLKKVLRAAAIVRQEKEPVREASWWMRRKEGQDPEEVRLQREMRRNFWSGYQGSRTSLPPPARMHMVAASATISRGVLLQLQRLFGMVELPKVIGVGGETRFSATPGGGIRKVGTARPVETKAQKLQRERAVSATALANQELQALGIQITKELKGPMFEDGDAARRAAAQAADASERAGQRGVAGVQVPGRIRHRVLTVADGKLDTKVTAAVDAVAHLKPRTCLAVLPDETKISLWLDRLREAGLPQTMLLHEAMGFPTLEPDAAPRCTRELLDAMSSLRFPQKRRAAEGTAVDGDSAEGALQREQQGEVQQETSSKPRPLPRMMLTTEQSVRGIDLAGLDCVLLLYCPVQSDMYVHLAGRTGRVRSEGTSLLVLNEQETKRIGLITSQLGVAIKQFHLGQTVRRKAEKHEHVLAVSPPYVADNAAWRSRAPEA